MRVQKCKGTKDLSPEEMSGFRRIEEIFRDCCLKWGYEEVRTPTLEYLHLFTATGTLTPSHLSKVYSFLDWDGWSGERVVLRPDGTIPVARFFIENMQEKEQAKLFYVTNIFAFEESGKETREKWQCGAELIGAGSAIADVALVTLALEVLKALGLERIELKLSHAGIIRALLRKLELSPAEQTKVLDQILAGNIEALAKIKPERPELGRILALLLNMKGKSSGFLKNVRASLNQDLSELEAPLKNFIDITELLETLGFNYQIDITSGRDFEYYTGMMFQLIASGEHIGGGGRYDALIPLLGGRDIPASGFALYLDRLMRLTKTTLAKSATPRILIKAEPKGNSLKEAFGLAERLRKAGYTAEVYLGGREPANFRWQIEIQGKTPQFVLTDQVNQQEFETKTAAEVLTQLKQIRGSQK